MVKRTLGKTGFEVSVIGYGGVVSSQHFDKAVMPGDGQKQSDQAVAWAIAQGINYFDVAPAYGDAQLLMGNSLKPWRDKVYVACKTNKRNSKDAEKEMAESLNLLHTDHFDVYQLHGLTSMEELETCFAAGGTMELLRRMKENGDAAKIGVTAHSEAAALRALDLYDFDTVMFPLNWHMNMAHDMGSRIAKKAKEKGCGLLGIKSMVEMAWEEEERYQSVYPKSWCKPFFLDRDQDLLLAAMKFSVSLGADVLIPPGNIDHFRFAVEHINEVLNHPLTEEDTALLKAHLPSVSDHPFYDAACYA